MRSSLTINVFLMRDTRIDEISAALGYTSDFAPKSIESLYKVHTASKCTSVTPVNLNFEVLGPTSFGLHHGSLTPGTINHPSCKSRTDA